MKLVLAEKPSVAQSIAKVLGANKREDGYLEGGGYVVSWCVGHLVELAEPESYDEKYGKWSYNDLPIFPTDWKYNVSSGTEKQFGILKKLMARNDSADSRDELGDTDRPSVLADLKSKAEQIPPVKRSNAYEEVL